MRTGYTVLSDSGGRSRASLSRGAFAEGDAFLASGDQSLVDFYQDDLDFDYLSHSQFSDHQHSFGSAPLDCVPDEYEPDDFTGSYPYALSVQAESILCRYLGDLYRINPQKGESFEADSQSGGRSSARSDLFLSDASLSGDTSGINLPPVLAAEFLHLDSKPTLCATPSTAASAFCFGEDEHTRFFSPQTLAPDTEAFGRSLKAPDANPLVSKDYRLLDKSWQFVSEASAFAARLAAYSTALVDLLIRADELEVSEEDKASVHGLLLDLSALNFSQASRMKLHATKRRRHLALSALKLPKDFNDNAVDRISCVGPRIFGGKFLEVVDSDLTMNKRAKEVTDRYKLRLGSVSHGFRGGRSSFYSGQRGFRSRGGGRTRFPLSRSRGGFRSAYVRRLAPPKSTR